MAINGPDEQAFYDTTVITYASIPALAYDPGQIARAATFLLDARRAQQASIAASSQPSLPFLDEVNLKA
jgi:hypothetical protein